MKKLILLVAILFGLADMSFAQDDVVEFRADELEVITAGARQDGNSLVGESSSDIKEYTYPNRPVDKIGMLQNMAMTVTVTTDATGTRVGHLYIRWTEQVTAHRIVSGGTTVSALDAEGNVLATWDYHLFRQCGTHARSLSVDVTAQVALVAAGFQFRTNGSLTARRC